MPKLPHPPFSLALKALAAPSPFLLSRRRSCIIHEVRARQPPSSSSLASLGTTVGRLRIFWFPKGSVVAFLRAGTVFFSPWSSGAFSVAAFFIRIRSLHPQPTENAYTRITLPFFLSPQHQWRHTESESTTRPLMVVDDRGK